MSRRRRRERRLAEAVGRRTARDAGRIPPALRPARTRARAVTRAAREPYAKAGAAMRQAFERAVRMSDDLKSRDWRVLLACAVLTASYSRTRENTSVGQIASMCGLSYARTSESLVRLADAGVIVWRGGRRPGTSRLSLLDTAYNLERMFKRRTKSPLRVIERDDDEGQSCPF